MANVSIKFNGKEFLLSCDDGQEEHLEELLIQLNKKFNELKNDLGNLGENKLLLITAVKVMDEYHETRKKIEQKKDELKELSNSLINRISIGIQSFNDQDLKLMNRSHNSFDSINCIDNSLKYFDNISIDLIYGMPNSNLISWEKNLNLALNWDLNHISAYALTVEPKTALEKYIQKEIILPLDEEFVYDQFNLMYDKLSDLNFINYELSSFAKKGYFSKNNSGYWLGKKYVGIGPSSHSFDGFSRSWNVSNNTLYISDIKNNKMYHQKEKLTQIDQYNEYIMTGLRTMWGISLSNLQEKFGKKIENHFVKKSKKFIESELLIIENNLINTSKKGKFLSDGIASELFLINR